MPPSIFLPSLAELHQKRQVSEALANDPSIAELRAMRRQTLSDAVALARRALENATPETRENCEAALESARSDLDRFEGRPLTSRRDVAFCAGGVAFISGAVPAEFHAQVAEQERHIPRHMDGMQAMTARQARLNGPPLGMGAMFVGDPTLQENWR